MLKFPDKVKIRIIEGFSHKQIKIPNIVISIHAFAMKKNDYFLGPFFSNENGEFEIDKNTLEIFADAEMQTGIMDYRKINECSSLIEIRIISLEEIENLLKGREVWGIVGREKEFYNTKEELLNRIKKNNNNLVLPQTIRVTWDKDAPYEISYEIMTNLATKL
jgi:hypothetical protein